ncbi:MAG: hypothetical protein NC489_25575, partial [Ruminococcus flavefaciens]|nr:hypothetical protein [Ruminococcus flavefaciens]
NKIVLYDVKNYFVHSKDDKIDIVIHTHDGRKLISAMITSINSLMHYDEDVTKKVDIEKTVDGYNIMYSLTEEQIRHAMVVDLLFNIITDGEVFENGSREQTEGD